jgi:HAD superfamily hydrolase (TIGR01484 family)
VRPIGDFPAAARRRIRGVFTDIDDTLTTDGRLTTAAYGALERLSDAGFLCVPITGRPAGWCDHIARMWPVDAVVGENGAFYFRYDAEKRRMIRRFFFSRERREADRRRLERIRERVLAEVPGSAVASDQLYREADLAIDFCEDVPRLPAAAIDAIVDIFRSEGATAKISSIHVNGWFGDYDKLTMTRLLLAECFGVDLDAEKERYVFVGDSPNDEPMFAYFPHAVGVANVGELADRLETPPAYLTGGRAGSGFTEVAEALLAAGNSIPRDARVKNTL